MTIHIDRILIVLVILWSPFLIGLPVLIVSTALYDLYHWART